MFWKKKPKYPTTQITKDNFKELVLESKVPVLLDFYGDSCGPCKVLSPIIDELAEENEGTALVAKVNTAYNPELSHLFKIKSIPTLIFFDKGEMTERYSGLIPKPNLQEILDEYVNSSEENKPGTQETPPSLQS